jgi:hypothetical protein
MTKWPNWGTQPQLKRPFYLPRYLSVSLLFSALVIGLVRNTVIERPGGTCIGIGLVACGIPAYFSLSNLRCGEVKKLGVWRLRFGGLFSERTAQSAQTVDVWEIISALARSP